MDFREFPRDGMGRLKVSYATKWAAIRWIRGVEDAIAALPSYQKFKSVEQRKNQGVK